MAEKKKKSLLTKRTASGAQQYTSSRMKDEGPSGYKAKLMAAARKKASEIGGMKGAAFARMVQAADSAASSETSISRDIKELYNQFEKKWAARARASMQRHKSKRKGK